MSNEKLRSNLKTIDRTLNKYLPTGWDIADLENLIIKRIFVQKELHKEPASQAGRNLIHSLTHMNTTIQKIDSDIKNNNLDSVEDLSEYINRLKDELEGMEI